MLRPILLCSVLAACGGPVEEVRVLDRSQRLSAIVHRREGVKQGPVTLFWPDGTAKAEGQYHEDRRTGWWWSHYRNGATRSIMHYAHGLKDGPRIYWDSLGHPLRAEVFAKGLPHGPFYRFSHDGRIAQHSNYVDGLLEGPHHQWYDHGGASYLNGFYHKGREVGLWTEYDTTGHMLWQAYLKDGEVERALYGTRRRH